MDQNKDALHVRLVRAITARKAATLPQTFLWGYYGSGQIGYDNQPYVLGLLEISDTLEEALPVLEERPKPKSVKREFLLAKEISKESNLNVSRFDDSS